MLHFDVSKRENGEQDNLVDSGSMGESVEFDDGDGPIEYYTNEGIRIIHPGENIEVGQAIAKARAAIKELFVVLIDSTS